MTNPTQAELTYYGLLVLGYGWSVVQLCAKEPFDAFVLFIITFFLQSYRNAVRKEVSDLVAMSHEVNKDSANPQGGGTE